jgi:hypothetical protein
MPHNPPPELQQLEARLQTTINRALAPARREAARRATTPADITRRNARTTNHIRQARAALTDTLTRTLADAAHHGLEGATREAPPPDGTPTPRLDDATLNRLLGGIDPAGDIQHIVTSETTAIDTRRPDNLPTRITQTAARILRLAITRITDAYNRARRWYATQLGYGLRWITVMDTDVCEICLPLEGTTISADEPGFASDLAAWEGLRGFPPSHWMCRCYIQIVPTS